MNFSNDILIENQVIDYLENKEVTLLRYIIANGKIITPLRIVENKIVIVEEGKITSLSPIEDIALYKEYTLIDANGNYISPGFIDIHTHGAGGYDFMDGTVECFIEAAKAQMIYGTTSLVPTTLTSTMEDLYNTFNNFKIAKQKNIGPNLLGLHLEGPYFSLEQKGAQDPKYIKNPESKEYMKILEETDDIVRWSVAPELDGAMKMGELLTKKGIVMSVAHSDATYENVLEAYENGYNLITHFYSGMSTVKRINAYRHAGVVEAGYLIDEMFLEIIADGHHLPKSLLKLICKEKSSDKICLVTDSMRAAGCLEGEYILGNLKTGQKVIVEDGIAKTLDRKSFAGSVATADQLVRVMKNYVGVSIEDAVKMMTLNPAKIMKVDSSKGIIASGKDADIIIFDENINIKLVMINGNIKINKN